MKSAHKYSTTFYRKSVLTSITAFSVVLLLFLSICIIVLYNSNQSYAKSLTQTENDRSINQLTEIIENTTRICLFFSEYKVVSPVFQSQTEFDLRKSTLQREMTTFISSFDYIAGITVDTGEYILNAGTSKPNSEFEQLKTYNGFNVFYSKGLSWPHLIRISNVSYGTDTFDVSIDIYASFIGKQHFNERAFCINEDGTVLIANDTDLLGRNISEIFNIDISKLLNKTKCGKYIFESNRLHNSDIYIVTLLNTFSQQNNFYLQTLITFLICVFLLSVGILMILYVFQRIYQPIDKVVQIFKYYIPNNETFAEDDIRFISECTDDRDMDEATTTAVLQLRKSQLYTLHAQISPHFLANSLDILKWETTRLLGMENPIEESLDILSMFLCEAQQYAKMFATVGEEIERTKQYVRLAANCFNKNLKVIWNVGEDTLRYSIVSLTLQPLIENSIIHGFIYDEYKEKATITVSIISEDANILITIRDNGCGMSQETLDELHKILLDNEPCDRHIGIKNTHLKLKLLYGEGYGITKIENINSGTSVELLIPKYIYPPEK